MPEFKVGIIDFSVFFFALESLSRGVGDAVPFGAAAYRVDDSNKFGPKCLFFFSCGASSQTRRSARVRMERNSKALEFAAPTFR